MRIRTCVLLISVLLAGLAFYSPPPVQASCEVQVTPRTYDDVEFIGADLCDDAGSKKTLTTTGSVTSLDTLLAGEDQDNNALAVEGANVRGTVGNLATAVTTDTTSAAVALPIGSKSIYGSVTGTGAVTQTQAIYGGITSGVTSTTGILLCTLTLSGTTTAVDACPVITANYLFYIVVTTATTGTGASGVVTAMY